MPPNQFASMLHTRANKMSTILVHAVLEWLLILLLLLNSLFYYIIRKFAIRFGLKPPCLLCSHNTNTNENLLCETHTTEISEKSAMQMEALHYQRMMEEQSEYDQVALQILNALIIKREKEKLKLEKDLEVYKKKVLDYEAKEKMMMKISKTATSINSSASSSNIDEDDELFIDFINIERAGDQCDEYNSTSELVSEIEENGRECMKHLGILDESIAQFEDERVSILEELKALEGKLFTLAHNDEETFEDERLVPLFDATNFDSDEGEMNEEERNMSLVEMKFHWYMRTEWRSNFRQKSS